MKWAALFIALSSVELAQTATVSVKTPVFPGLRITLATDPGVQEFVTSAVAASATTELNSLLPYSVVLENGTAHTICAYTLRLTFVDAQGRSGTHNRQYFNLSGTASGDAIGRGSNRLVTPISSLAVTSKGAGQGSTSSTGRRSTEVSALVDRLRTQVAVAVTIDLIAFDTGRVIGPDDGNTLSYLRGYLIGEREAASFVSNALGQGASIASVSQELEALGKKLAALSSIQDIARASQMRRYAGLSRHSRDALVNEVNRVLAKAPFEFYR